MCPFRSVSPSRQFIIYASSTALRGAVSELAEQTKANLLTLLRQPDRWKTPIVVNLQPAQANLPEIPSAALRFSQTGFGLKLQLDLPIGESIDAALVERELLRAILLEMIYRSEPDVAPGTAFVEPPDWLLDGVLAIMPGRDRGPLVEALSVSDKQTSVEEFLRQRPANLDSPARLLYRAYSLALLQFLVDGPAGRSQLSAYITNLSRASNDQLADLKGQFPGLRSADLEAVWKAHVTRFASADNRFQLFAFAETDRKLDELLEIRISEGAGSGKAKQWEDLLRTKPSPIQAGALQAVSQNLMVLAASANPVM